MPTVMINRLRTVKGFLLSFDTAVRDRWIAALFVVLAFVPALGVIGAEFGDLPRRPSDAFTIVLVLALTVPLAFRGRWPAACLAVVGVAFVTYQALAYAPTFGSIGLYLALYSVGAHQVRFRREVAAVAVAVCVVFTGVLYLLGTPDRLLDFVVFFPALSAFWVLGAFVRRHRADEAERRQRVAHAATAAERARIARELHDVVSHHLTSIVVQAEATQFLTSSPERVGQALTAIGGSGRWALAELRYLLQVLETSWESAGDTNPEHRAPSLGAVRDLVEQARLGGQPVELVEEGEQPHLSVGVGLVVYRVVQEALTNAVKYAASKPTEVRLGYRPGRVDVVVTTDAPAAVPAAGSGPAQLSGGRGLAGLRERVGAVGGELTAEEQPEGRFRVHASIPLDGG